MPVITILLAAFEGARYLEQQIQSVLAQTETNWRLIIRDDASSDETARIAKRYALRHPEKIRLITAQSPSGGAKNNFSELFAYADTDYGMTCDQDDFWLADKVALTLEKMHEMESLYGRTVPLLVHTDLCVADSRLQTLSPSLFQRQHLNKRGDKLENLLVQNVVTGCTMMFNRPLLQAAAPVPARAIMHDWWFALTAAALGKIGFIDRATILYRQHEKNAVGAKDVSRASYYLRRLGDLAAADDSIVSTYAQAAAFYERFSFALPEEQRRLVEAYARSPTLTGLQKAGVLFRYHLWKYGLSRKAGQLFLSLTAGCRSQQLQSAIDNGPRGES